MGVFPDARGRELLHRAVAFCNRTLGFVNAPAFMQHVISSCLEADVDVSHYAAKRDRLCAALDAGGYDYARPEGTFYLFPKTPGVERAFVERARKKLLLVVPGSSFGQEGYFRISFATSDATVDLACSKLLELGNR